MSIRSKAVAWMCDMAADPDHGYDQGDRWGPDYDCSSAVITAYELAGVPVKTNGATYTGNMCDVFIACGFVDVTASVDLSTGAGLKAGDVVWKSGHTEMVSGEGYLVGASINENGETTGGETGDQTGSEFRERAYYSGWTRALRYPGSTTYGHFWSANRYLSQTEMEDNAAYIYRYLTAKGWSINAIAGLLGNMETESTINPGIWQTLKGGNTSGGYGLVQWTPATKYISWCEDEGLQRAYMDTALDRLEYELENKLQYYSTTSYPITFQNFKVSDLTPGYLAKAFMINYERPANQSATNQAKRASQAEAWYEFLTGVPAKPSGSGLTRRKKLPLWLLLTAARRRVR